MIVKMKKVTLLVLEAEKKNALTELRRLGLLHIEETAAGSERLAQLKDQVASLERAVFAIEETKPKRVPQETLGTEAALAAAERLAALTEDKKNCRARITALGAELDRMKNWGEIDPAVWAELAEKGVALSLCEMPAAAYEALDNTVTTIRLSRSKTAVRCLVLEHDRCGESDSENPVAAYRVPLPSKSTAQLREDMAAQQSELAALETGIAESARYTDALHAAVAVLKKDIEFESHAAGMLHESISDDPEKELAVAWLNGYIPEEDLGALSAAAKAHAWGLATEDPTEDDNVPTKLKNNKFISLIYPLTDFLGTVPGYFEYDISGWFLGFMLIFFGIIFGDGGYGLLITGVAAVFIIKAKAAKKPVAPLFWLVALLGLATVLWGLLTCTWFGLTVEQIPAWLRALSLPLISNVNAERLWYPFWTNGTVGLTTAQNLQIFCFSLALIQLAVAHIKGMIQNRKSLKFLGELGSLLQLIGMFYVVLTLVVSGEVFGLSRVIGGVPIGTVSIVLVAVGFALSFVFASYEGSIKDSILDSVKNIISILLGVVNVFSDIVSYIRLWAVGLAGAAISATVNEMAGPMLGRLTMVIFAVILLVFGHGLNIILNVLSVVVHGVRLNTLEFSSHLGMNWSGHKYEPFRE